MSKRHLKKENFLRKFFKRSYLTNKKFNFVADILNNIDNFQNDQKHQIDVSGAEEKTHFSTSNVFPARTNTRKIRPAACILKVLPLHYGMG